MSKQTPIITPTFAWMLQRPHRILAFGFGSGLSPIAPGTFGSLVALPMFWWLHGYGLQTYLLVILVGFAVGVWVCEKTTQDLGVDDYGGIVWDEVVGQLIASAPLLIWKPEYLELWLIASFVLFRIFDIWKPYPIRELDKNVHGGLGIMLDDELAGLFAAMALTILLSVVTPGTVVV